MTIALLFVVLPGSLLLDLAGPAEAFRLANQQAVRHGRSTPYALRFVGPVVSADSSVGTQLSNIEPLPASLPAHSRVLLLGQPSGSESPLQRPLRRSWLDTRRWLAAQLPPLLAGRAGGDAGAEADIRLITVCAGALLAGDAGLLSHRRCTTHHELLPALQALAPTAQVQANRLFVIDGGIASSAGITAGIDLALHLIERDCGPVVAAAVAQTMLVHRRRGLLHPAQSPMRAGRDHLHPALHRVQDAIAEDPAQDWSLATMAEIAHVTPRHLSRLFRDHVGRSPRAYVEDVRVAIADEALAHGENAKRALPQAGIAGTRQWRRLRQRRRAVPGAST